MYFRHIGYDIVYDDVVCYDIVADVVVPRTGFHIGKTDIVPDIVYVKPDILSDIGYKIVLMYPAFIRCCSHCSKQ